MPTPKKYAFLVGVEEYQSNSQISNLKYAVRDVVELGKALHSSCGFDHICIFAGDIKGSKGPANQNAVIDELEDWANIVEPDDLFVFAFIGHGMEQGDRGYLLPADARLGRPNTFIELSHLDATFRKIRAREHVVLLDCCRNDPEAGRGDTANALSDAFSRDITSALQSGNEGQTVSAWLTACDKGERAYEWDRVKHGVFTWNLINAIKEGAWKDGKLTVNAIGEYVQEKVESWRGGASKQTPQYKQSGGAKVICLAKGKRVTPAKGRAHLDDPSKVEIKSFALDPFEIELEEIMTPSLAPANADFPSLPDDIRKKQGKILGLEQAISQIEKRTHPSLKAAKAEVSKAKRQLTRLTKDRDQAWAKHGVKCPAELMRIFGVSTETDVFQQSKFHPEGVEYTDCIDLVYRVRNTEKARKAMRNVERALETKCNEKLAELKANKLLAQNEIEEQSSSFLTQVITKFLKDQDALEKGTPFPGEAFIPFARSIKEYGFVSSDEKLWKMAREIQEEQKQVPTKKALELKSQREQVARKRREREEKLKKNERRAAIFWMIGLAALALFSWIVRSSSVETVQPDGTIADENKVQEVMTAGNGASSASGALAPDLWKNEWETLTPGVRNLIDALPLIDGRIDIAQDVKGDMLKLSWYENAYLVRLSGGWTPNNLNFYFLYDGEGELVRLNGTSANIHSFNKRSSIILNDETIKPYLWFFMFFVRGEEGAFLLVQNSNDTFIPKANNNNYDTNTLNALTRLPRPAVCESSSGQYAYKCSAVVYYSNAMFEVELGVESSGMVSMLEDIPIATNLEVKVNAPIAVNQ